MPFKKKLNILVFALLPFLMQIDALGDAPHFKVKKVVIDAGHGGKDPGAIGKHLRTKEKDVALAIALKVGAYIENRIPSVEVIYTRSSDRFIELHERAAIANKNQADLFISIHANASRKTSPYGTETFVLGLHKNDENLEVAKRENAVILMEEDYQGNYDNFDPNSDESHIIFSLIQNAHIDQSIAFASFVEDQFQNRAGRQSRGVKQAGFLVLHQTTMPSVLIETGFLSNQNEEKYLRTDEGQSLIASAIFRAFRDYKEQIEGTATSTRNTTTKNQPEQKPVLHNSPETEKPKNITHYRIQLYNSYEAVDLSAIKNNPVETIEIELNDNGTKNYLLIDPFQSKSYAETSLAKLLNQGYKYARIVPYNGDQRLEP